MQNTHISDRLPQLHGALLEIVGAMNRPQRDEMMIREAGIKLDRALFPLLVGIARFGPIGVVEMADRVGRDYTTVSRQVARLEQLGLVQRSSSEADRRIRNAVVTPQGLAMTQRIDAARERIMGAVFAGWSQSEIDEFTRLAQRFADGLNGPHRPNAPAPENAK